MDNNTTPAELAATNTDTITADFTINEENRFGNLFPERQQSIQELTQVVKLINKPFTMTITSEWGTGKTYFLKTWQQQLEKENIPCIYYNAWEFEQDTDPLVALIANITSSIKTELDLSFLQNLSYSIKSKTNKNNMIDLSSIIANITGSLLSQGAVTNVGTETLSKFKNNSPTYTDNSLLTNLITLKDKIQKSKKYENSKYPIVVMIDELDRCKPDYVITLLERIKHIFTIPGYLFVLSMDQEQLYTTVEHVFGFKNNSKTNKDLRTIYLQKFIDFNYILPKPELSNYIKQIVYSHIKTYPNDFINNCSTVIPYLRDNRNFFKSSHIFELLYDIVKTRGNNAKIIDGVADDIIQILQFVKIINLRDFEKKFEKFYILYQLYSPYTLITFLLLLAIFEEINLNKFNKLTHINNIEELTKFLSNNNESIFSKILHCCNYKLEKGLDLNELTPTDNDLNNYIIVFSYAMSNYAYGHIDEILSELQQMLNFSKHITRFDK